MKKVLIYSLSILGLLWSCEPMGDIYDELEEKKEPYNENIEYTFLQTDYNAASDFALEDAEDKTDSTYANYISTDMAFNEYFTAAGYVGPVLSTNFPALDKQSSAVVTYNVNIGKPSYLNDYTQAEEYELTVGDYNSVGDKVAEAGYFVPSMPAVEYIPTILGSNVTATEGDLRLVMYNESEYEPSTGGGPKTISVFNEDFADYVDQDPIDQNGWTNYVETGTLAWVAREYNSNIYAQFSSYSTGEANVAYLITPGVNLDATVNNLFTFGIKIGYWTHEGLEIFISTDYDGSDYAAATWTDITSNFTIPTEPVSGYSAEFIDAGSFDLSAYSGTVYFSFKYTGDDNSSETTTYQIDNIMVQGEEPSKKKSSLAELYNTYNKFYEFDGTSWDIAEGVIALSAPDYDAMGEPGNYDNFSSDVPPSNYIPRFLELNKPYATEGEAYAVVYKYYDGSTLTLADEYTFNAGLWSMFDGIVEESNQFIHTGEEWVFDPTIRFDMVNSDYQMIVEWVKVNLSPDYLDSYGTAEFYHGASAYYANYDLRLSKRTEFGIPGFDGLSQEAAVDLTWERLAESIQLMLSLKYPNAVTDVSGIDVHYFVSFDTYENDLSKNNYTIEFQCTKSGPDPEFTQIGDIVINNK